MRQIPATRCLATTRGESLKTKSSTTIGSVRTISNTAARRSETASRVMPSREADLATEGEDGGGLVKDIGVGLVQLGIV